MSDQDVFLCGLLRDTDVQRMVLGDIPVGLIAASASGGDGVVLPAPTEVMRARLTYFAAVHGILPTLVDLTLAGGARQTAVAYLAGQGAETPDKAVQVRMVNEIMEHFGRYSAEYMAERLPGVLRRATSYVATQALTPDLTRDLSRDVVVHQQKRPYLNFFAIEEMNLQFRRYDGELSELVNRGALLVGHVAVVLPYDPVRDCVLLVEQFRAPAFMAGSPAPWIWQPIAGLIDPGETAAQAARREAKEEAGITLSYLENIAQVYSSPGSSSEFVHIFVGIADLTDAETIAGLAEEDEDIRSQVLTFDALMQGIDDQTFCDLPLLASSLWLARHRDRLRKMA